MISAVILTKNEEKNIPDLFKSLKFCDEIIVVDDDSEDKTVKIAKKLGAKVYMRKMNMDVSFQSNFAMKKSKGDWVLFLDADERISDELREEIKRELKDPKDIMAFRLRRIDYMWGKWLRHGESGAFGSFRLVRKNSGKWVRRVHQTFKVRGKIKDLKNPILHYPHQNLREFIKSIDRWSSWHAIANKEEGKRSTLFKIIFYPFAHFIKNFFFRFGFLDGIQGFVFAFIMSFHSYLAWSKLWILQRRYTKN